MIQDAVHHNNPVGKEYCGDIGEKCMAATALWQTVAVQSYIML